MHVTKAVQEVSRLFACTSRFFLHLGSASQLLASLDPQSRTSTNTTMASRPPTTKRSTVTPYTLPVERPPCTIDPTAVVADKATIIGTYPVEIAEHAVIHPYARIRAEGGRVTIGPYWYSKAQEEGEEATMAMDYWSGERGGRRQHQRCRSCCACRDASEI